MCDPGTLAVASFGLQAGSAIFGAAAQNRAADAAKASASNALLTKLNDIAVRSKQEFEAANADIYGASKQTVASQGTAAASAAEGGVGGISTRMLLANYDRDQADYTDSVRQNLGNTFDQLRSLRAGAVNDYEQTLAGIHKANPFAVGLQIGGAALDLAGSAAFKKPKGLSKTSTLPPAPDIPKIDLSGIKI